MKEIEEKINNLLWEMIKNSISSRAKASKINFEDVEFSKEMLEQNMNHDRT